LQVYEVPEENLEAALIEAGNTQLFEQNE
jgi:hypothetical protein